MLKQYFSRKTNKNKPAQCLDFILKKMPKFFADKNAEIRQYKSYQAYDYNRGDNGAGDK